jgi:hypothetical protein
MEIFLYWLGEAHVAGRDVIEDAIEEALGDKGEVTGGGSGDTGGNIDIEIFDEADVEPLMSEIAMAVSGDLPENAYYRLEYDEERRLLRELLPGFTAPPEPLRWASAGICSGLNRALADHGGGIPFECRFGMVDGTAVISQLVGRLPVETVRERLERWAAGEASTLIGQSLALVGATAWEAHYNGVVVLRVPIARPQ